MRDFLLLEIIFATDAPRFVLTSRKMRTVKHAQFTDPMKESRKKNEAAVILCQCRVKVQNFVRRAKKQVQAESSTSMENVASTSNIDP